MLLTCVSKFCMQCRIVVLLQSLTLIFERSWASVCFDTNTLSAFVTPCSKLCIVTPIFNCSLSFDIIYIMVIFGSLPVARSSNNDWTEINGISGILRSH
jgi:hypothetical protein